MWSTENLRLNLFGAPRRRTDREEIDAFDQPLADLRQSFRNIAWVNRRLGGTAVVLKALERLVVPLSRPLTIVDACTGSADIPRAIVAWAIKRKQPIRVTAFDANPAVLCLAREQPGAPTLLKADAVHMPLATGACDIALCSLSLHHFEDDEAIAILRELRRVSRHAFVVNDLRRGDLPAILIWLITRALRMNRLTRHDAPLSVLKSRTIGEYADLVRRAGIDGAEVRRQPFWRAVIIAGATP